MKSSSPAPDTASVPPVVTLEGVSKRFATGTEALRGIDLTIPRGAFVCVLGPSGCGKTTLLRLIAGLTEPTSGSVRRGVDGPDRGGDVGFVFQEPTLMPWATALGNVALPLSLAGMARTEREARAADLLGRLGLRGFERAYPRELSGGMRMRVSIARALVTEPDILLMDEPFAALDEITRHALEDDLLALREGRRFTTVFVTHSVAEAVYLSPRVVVMAARPGRITADLELGPALPRTDEFRTSAEGAALCRIAAGALKRAMAA